MIDHQQQALSFSGAARPLYIITEQKLEEGDLLIKHNSDGKKSLYELKGDIYSIGASNRNHVFTEQTIPIVKSDRIYLFSDGYTDQFGGEKDKKYNRLRLRNTLLSSHQLSIEEQKELLEKELNDWMGQQEQTDDITLMALEI
jgi:serine phosphatase RsbU (regulator of sigma subunit)